MVPSLRIAVATKMTEDESFQKHLEDLMELEEECFIGGFHQTVSGKAEVEGMARPKNSFQIVGTWITCIAL